MEELLKLKEKSIYINKELSVKLNEQTLFKADGGEGLHLWEASVVLTRYCLQNKEKFVNKNIIELGTGCGLLGISILKQIPEISHFTFSDYQDSVLNNLKSNIIKNNLKENKKYNILKFDWRDYEDVDSKYDIILGSELIYQGGFIQELAKLINKLLKDDGFCYISMPEKRSMTKKFLEYINECGLKYQSEYYDINNEELFADILKNSKENKKLFENLKDMKLMLYKIFK